MFYTENGVLSAIAAFLIGVFMFLPVSSLMMIPQELPGMTPAKLTVIMGIFWALSYIIETIAYFIIGLIIDYSGYTMGLNLALIMSITFFPCLRQQKRANKKCNTHNQYKKCIERRR